MIYLDNAATTKPFENVTELINTYYTEKYFNPSALYAPAYTVADDVSKCRDYISSVLGSGGKVFFTSCATESNAWVFNSAVKNKKGNIVVSMGEHASVYENAIAQQNKGLEVRFVKLQSDGKIDAQDLDNKTDANTTLVSVIHASNETGAVNNIKELSAIAKNKNKNLLFHSDGVQALGKIDVNCRNSGIDLYSISAHKIGGVKGIGGLWIRDGIRLNPLLSGGGQEGGLRSGTENVAAIAGFCEALKTFLACDRNKIKALRDFVIGKLSEIPDVSVVNSADCSPFIISFSASGVKAEILQRVLCENGILVGLGSACSSRMKKNRVLSAMGKSMSDIEGSMRISFSPQNISDDMNYAVSKIKSCILELRKNK